MDLPLFPKYDLYFDVSELDVTLTTQNIFDVAVQELDSNDNRYGQDHHHK